MFLIKMVGNGLATLLDRISESDIEFDALRGHKHRVAARTFQASEALNKYDIVRISGVGTVGKASSDPNKINLSLARAIGIVTSAATIGQNVMVVTWGEISNAAWGLNPGELCWVTTTPGGVSNTPGAVRGLVGVAIDSSTIFVRPESLVTVG